MRILLLGATGRTGKLILEQALGRDHTVHVLVRDKNKVAVIHPKLVVFEGSPLDKEALDQAMRGCEAVLSGLNVSRQSDWPWAKLLSPEYLMSATMNSIIELAPKNNINRIIFISAWGVAETKQDLPAWFRWLIDHSNVRYPYMDHERQETLISQTTLAYTSIRPAGLTNSKKKKKVIVTVNNQPKPGLMISRSNVAAFMLDVLEKNLFPNKMVVIST